MKLQCHHDPKKFRIAYSCEKTGDYELILCRECHKNESQKFLISEEEISEK
jgi:hypothetical protein